MLVPGAPVPPSIEYRQMEQLGRRCERDATLRYPSDVDPDLLSCHPTFALSGRTWETRQYGYRHWKPSLNSGVAPVAVDRVGEPWRHLVAVATSR